MGREFRAAASLKWPLRRCAAVTTLVARQPPMRSAGVRGAAISSVVDHQHAWRDAQQRRLNLRDDRIVEGTKKFTAGISCRHGAATNSCNAGRAALAPNCTAQTNACCRSGRGDACESIPGLRATPLVRKIVNRPGRDSHARKSKSSLRAVSMIT